MSEELRSTIRSVVVKPSEALPTLYVGGDYNKPVPTPGEGAAAAAGEIVEEAAEEFDDLIEQALTTAEAEDIGAVILFPIILPVAVIAGAIVGGAATMVMAQIQEFRDNLTGELGENDTRPLPTDVLAEDLLSYLETLSDIDATPYSAQAPLPTDADAILTVEVTGLTVIVDGGDAIMTTTATADLRRVQDNSVVYYRSYRFVDKDSLRSWTRNDNALWIDYVERTRHYFTRTISDDFFERIILRHVLRPARSDSFSGGSGGGWSGTVKTSKPTLAWELFLLGGDAYGSWTEQIEETDIVYDLEIYDGSRLIYSADDIPTPFHEVREPLAGCTTFSWSVRPVYQIDGKSRAGDWMGQSTFLSRINPPGTPTNPDSPELSQGYPQIKTRCR
jgi:hypothetical protein